MSENLIGATTAVFPIRLSVAVASPVDVEWATRDGSAVAGSDYKATAGTVTFLPGETEKQIEVQVYGQAITPSDDKVFFIRLNPPSNAVLVDAILTCTINIIDDQGIPSVAVVVAEGRRGPKGDPGLSAYEQAVLMGYTGTLIEWMDQIADASKAADRAGDHAVSASEDALKAQNAAKNAVFAGVVFPTAAEGVDPVLGVQNGAYFNVRSPLSEHYIDEYQNVNGVAVATGKSYPTSDYVQYISEHTALPFVLETVYKLNQRVILTNGDIVKSTVDGNTNDPNVNMTGWVLETIRSVSSPSDLIALQNPKNKQRVYAESLQKTFIYDANLTTPENGVTVVGKWEMEIQEAYYASDLLPRSSIDNVAEPQDVAINKLYQYATSNGRAFIIDQPYYVESKIKGGGESYPALNPFNGGGVSHAIRIQSNSVLAFMGEGALKLAPSSLDFTAILLVHDVENYVILDPKCYGDRYSHLTTTGEQGIAYHFGPSKNGYVRNPYAENCWGDGFYFGFTFYVKPFIDVIVPTNLVIDNPRGYDMSRNGISLCGADDLTINSPYMEKVDRLAPKAGIDIEPEEDIAFTDKMFIRNVKIHNATFVSCGYGYAHNVFGNRQVEVSFTGTTKILNKGSITSWIPMLLQSRLNSGQAVSDYQQQGYIDFDKVIVDDIGSSLAFKYLMIVATPEKSVPVTINSYEFISTNYEPEIALDQANEYTKSSGLTVKEFVFRKPINQVKLVFEAAVTKAIPSIDYYLGIPDSVAIVYRGKGITFHGKCFVGGYDLLSGALLNENQLINNVFIQPGANAGDGGAIYGRVTINNNERKVRYSLTPALSAAQIGYGLQVSGTGFFKTSTTPNASIELKQIAYPAGVQVYSSYGSWVNP